MFKIVTNFSVTVSQLLTFYYNLSVLDITTFRLLCSMQ